jgi:putative ABC transport system permease protein
MNLLDSLAVGLRALSVNKMRSMLTVLGIIIGVAAVVCMVSVGSGAREEVSEKIRTLGANLVVIRPGAQLSGAARLETGTRQTLTEDDALALRRELTNVQAVAPNLSRPTQVVAGNNNWATFVDGIDNDYLVAREWRIANGRTFTLDELGSGTKVAIIGFDIGEALFPGVSAVGQSFRIGNVPFTVIGTLERKGQGAAGRSQDDIVFIPLSTAKSRVLGAVRGPSREAMDVILIKASDQLAIPQVKTDITSLLRARHHLRPDAADDFSIENPADVLTARESAVRTLAYLLIAVASVSLVVGGISIMNVMLVSVTERTREIGLRMAVGAQRRDIRRQFLTESIALALAGGCVGIVVGCIGAAIVAWQAGWPVLISPEAILLSCVSAALSSLPCVAACSDRGPALRIATSA